MSLVGKGLMLILSNYNKIIVVASQYIEHEAGEISGGSTWEKVVLKDSRRDSYSQTEIMLCT